MVQKRLPTNLKSFNRRKEKLVLPGGGRVGVGRADEEKRKSQLIKINIAILSWKFRITLILKTNL